MLEFKRKDICGLLRNRILADGLLQPRSLRSFTYAGEHFQLTADDSLILEFPTPIDQFPQAYRTSTYRVLLTIAFHDIEDFRPALLNEIDRFRKKENISLVLLWSVRDLDAEQVALLKSRDVDAIVSERIPDDDDARPIKSYHPLKGESLRYSLTVNYLVDALMVRLTKIFHLILSEIAAPIYDSHYGKDHIATSAVMEFEEGELRRLLSVLASEGRTDVAVDVGCGTGRHTLIMAEEFERVYAFDLSKKMVERLEEKKAAREMTNIISSQSDFEYEKVPDEDAFRGQVDLVVASFGMGSFVEDTPTMLERLHEWLAPGGYLFISFYNRTSLSSVVRAPWRDPSLSSSIDAVASTLRVTLPSSIAIDIFCRPYDDGLQGNIKRWFSIERTYHYPTLMALMPNAALKHDDAKAFFGSVDDYLAERRQIKLKRYGGRPIQNTYGHYVIVIGKKPEVSYAGYERIRALLRELPVGSWEFREHPPVRSISDVLDRLESPPPQEQMVKTIVLKTTEPGERQLLAVAIQADRKIDMTRLASYLGVTRRALKFATGRELIELGFSVGGVSPLGFAESDAVRILVDEGLRTSPVETLYMGTGNNRFTLCIRRSEFVRMIEDAEWLPL